MSEHNRQEWYPGDIEFFPSLHAPVYIRNRNDGTSHPVSPAEAKIFQALRGCRSIEGYIQHLEDVVADAVAEVGRDAIEPLLQRWIADGVLRSRSLLVRAFTDQQVDAGTAPPLVATVTAHRPQSLARWLESFAVESTGQVVIVDDSRIEEAIRGNGDVVRGFLWKRDMASEKTAGLHVISRAGRHRLAQTVADHTARGTLDPAVVKWGLLGDTDGYGEPVVSMGAARNALLLAGVHCKVVSIDDDILPRYATFTDVDPTAVQVGDRYSPYVHLYPDGETLMEDARPATDPMGELVETLGLTPPDDVDLTGLSPDIARDWERSAPRVVAARLGIYGARAIEEPYRVIQRREEFVHPDERNGERFSAIQRHGLRGRHTTALTVARHGFASAYYSFDGSTELPPFFPWGRMEDHAFSVLATWADRNALFADVPAAAYHDPTGKQPFSDMEIGRHSVNAGLYNLLTLRSFTRGILASDRARRMAALVHRYRDVGTLARSDFREFLRSVQTSYLRETREEIETQIATHRSERESLEPHARERMLRRYQDSVIRELANPESVVPTELRGVAGSVEDKLAFLQDNYRRWADLLEAWPVIRRTAAAIGFDELMKIAANE